MTEFYEGHSAASRSRHEAPEMEQGTAKKCADKWPATRRPRSGLQEQRMEMINHPNTAIARAEDVLAEARNCVERPRS